MAYEVYFDNMLFPIPPSKIDMKVGGNNSTVNLMNEGEFTIIKAPKLTTYDFEVTLPQVLYPFASYKNDKFVPAHTFTRKLKWYKDNKLIIRFRVIRTMPSGRKLFDTNTLVTLEDFTVKEEAKEGFDLIASISLKEYVPRVASSSDVTEEVQAREETKAPMADKTAKTYTVVKGDTLWGIAKKYYGDGGKYPVIAKENSIADPNRINIGQVLTIPVL